MAVAPVDPVSGQGAIITSPDRVHWTKRNFRTDHTPGYNWPPNAVVFGNGETSWRSATAGTILLSHDGVTWTSERRK